MLTADEISEWNSPEVVYLGWGTYIGSDESRRGQLLNGKTALARSTGIPERVALQFDDLSLEEAYGWWVYPAKDFRMDAKWT